MKDASTFVKSPATIVDRSIFYNGSTGNGGNAFAPDKQALLPGQSSTFQNYTNFDRGITGVSIDIKDLPASVTPLQMQNSLQLAQWDGINAAGFVALPVGVTPTVSAIQVGAGANGSSRVLITFPANSLRNTWLRVTVVANTTNILAQNDVFYFGNVVADVNVGNTATRLRVNAEDTGTIRLNQAPLPGAAQANNIFDINRDGRVDALDTFLVRSNQQPLGIVAPIGAPGPSVPAMFDNLAAPVILAVALASPNSTNIEQPSANSSVGYGNSATKIASQPVAPEAAPAVELPSIDVAYWYPPMEAFSTAAEELRKLRLHDDYFALL